MNVYVRIGNSDNKLTQQEWAAFVEDIEIVLCELPMHGAWFSRPDAPWQNACWLVDLSAKSPGYSTDLKAVLGHLAARYRQDSIAWAEAETEFIKPTSTTEGASQ